MTLFSWFRRRDTVIDSLIKAPVYRFTAQDDTLRVITERRREIAAQLRSEADKLDTGEARTRLRLVTPK